MRYLFCLFLLTSLHASSQTKPFEGEIQYRHLFEFKNPRIDTMQVLRFCGSSSQYVFKNGSYKWITPDGMVPLEYHSAETQLTYDKYRDNDTLVFAPGSPYDTILSYNIIPAADTVCGYICDRLEVLIGNKTDENVLLHRNISFTHELSLDPERFKGSQAYCAYEIYTITRSVHLRIEMKAPDWPFNICFEASKVIKRQVPDEELALPKNAILQQ
jgi:hypothetical protein